VAGFLDDPDPTVRESALDTAAMMLIQPHLVEYRPLIAQRVSTELAISPTVQYREDALRVLEAWGEDVTELRDRHVSLCRAERAATSDIGSVWAAGWNDEGR
jgi:hypothetical protein